jgi:hypothetical protein
MFPTVCTFCKVTDSGAPRNNTRQSLPHNQHKPQAQADNSGTAAVQTYHSTAGLDRSIKLMLPAKSDTATMRVCGK